MKKQIELFKYYKTSTLLVILQTASISELQQTLSITYKQAIRLMHKLESAGIVYKVKWDEG